MEKLVTTPRKPRGKTTLNNFFPRDKKNKNTIPSKNEYFNFWNIQFINIFLKIILATSKNESTKEPSVTKLVLFYLQTIMVVRPQIKL